MSIYHKVDSLESAEFGPSEKSSFKMEKSSRIGFLRVSSEFCELLVLASEELVVETSEFGVSVPLLVEDDDTPGCVVSAILLDDFALVGLQE